MDKEVNTNSSVTTQVSNEDNNYSVYVHICPNGERYFGVSKNIKNRWRGNGCDYKKNPKMWEAIQKYGWDNIEHHIITENVNKDIAIKREGLLIDLARKNGIQLLNMISSGGCSSDIKDYKKRYEEKRRGKRNAYYQQYDHEHRELRKVGMRKLRSRPEWKIYYRVANYNKYNTPIETPLEAKRKYLECGYIPSYIKNDDLK